MIGMLIQSKDARTLMERPTLKCLHKKYAPSMDNDIQHATIELYASGAERPSLKNMPVNQAPGSPKAIAAGVGAPKLTANIDQICWFAYDCENPVDQVACPSVGVNNIGIAP